MNKQPPLLQKLRKRAAGEPKTIVLAEGEDGRMLRAARQAVEEKVAEIVLLGGEEEIKERARGVDFNPTLVRIVQPEKSDWLDGYAEEFYQLRKHRGITRDEAVAAVKRPVYFAAMMVRSGKADGMVAGAVFTTREVARAAIYCLGLKPRSSAMSGAFLVVVPDCPYGEKGAFIFADCGIIPEPSVKQFVEITLNSAELVRFLLGTEPRVALLSYSTKGSAPVKEGERITEAVRLIKQAAPELKVDGELQLDAAIVPEIAQRKDPTGLLQGRANVLIFPDLNSGNIAYKLVQRLARAEVVGPVLLGLNYPAGDLSRGTETEEIVNTIAVTVIRAQQ